MKLRFTYRDNNSRLLLIFAGWGMDAGVFAQLRRPGYDIAVAWDYRSDDADLTAVAGYGEIVLIAWSMGVYEADRVLHGHRLPLSLTVAVNGTLHPVDNTQGIPELIFDGTLNGLNERSLMKFYRRICGSSEAFAAFKLCMPQRSIDELADELRAIRIRQNTGRYTHDSGHLRWDKVIVADNDAIIPTANQLTAWRGYEITLMPGSHFPDWQKLLDTLLIDKALVHDRFAKGFATYDNEADAQAYAARQLWQLWQQSVPTECSGPIIEIGYGTGIFTRMYAPMITSGEWQLWDLVDPTFDIPSKAEAVACDAESRIHTVTSDSISLVVSTSALQWFNSLPAFLAQISRILQPGGYLIASTFGPLTFRELAAAGASPLPYPDTTSISRYIEAAGLTTVHLSDEIVEKRFASPHDALRHIQATGANAVSSTASASRVRGILSRYPVASDGTASLTYQPIYIIATKS